MVESALHGARTFRQARQLLLDRVDNRRRDQAVEPRGPICNHDTRDDCTDFCEQPEGAAQCLA